MHKRIITIVVCLVLGAGLIYSYFFLHNFKNYKNNITIKAIPTDVSFILQIDNPSGLKNLIQNKINFKSEALAFDWFSEFYAMVNYLDSTPRYDLDVLEILSNKKITLSFHREGEKKVSPLFLYQLDNKAEQNKIVRFIEDESANIWSTSQRNYNSITLYQITDKKKKLTFFLATHQGILLASKSSLLVENGLRQLDTGSSLNDDQTFNKIFKTAGENCDINIFVNFQNLPETLLPLFTNSFKDKVSILKQMGGWGEFDINVNSNQVNINGFVYPAKNNSSINLLFKGMSGSSSKICKIIPSNTNFFLSYNIEGVERFKQNFHAYLKSKKEYANYHKKNSQLITGTSPEQYEDLIFEFIDDEFSIAYTKNSSSNPNEGKYLIIDTNSRSGCLENLSKLNGNKNYLVNYTYKLDEDTFYPIYKSSNLEGLKHIFSYILPSPPVKYFTFIDNYLVLADDITSLKTIIYSNELKKTIYYNKYYQEFMENYSYKENLFLYCDIAELGKLIGSESDFSLINPNKEQKNALSSFYGIGFQATHTNKLLYTNICLEYLPVREAEPRTIWQSGLDSTIITKPSLVDNHYTKEKEILVQDKSNMLYLIANNGKVLWQKKLDSPILSEVFQIDYYRNNKLQYLFNTKDKMYLLDRKGNYVERYPINFSSPASNGIALFDYDKNRNYRIFVACANKKTYVYDKSGKIITGWKAEPTEGIVSKPIQHFRIQNKDYIVLSDNKRNYILNRRGENRVTVSPSFISNSNSHFFDLNDGTPSIITTDCNGNVQKINLSNGKCSTSKVIDSKTNHYFISKNISQHPGNELLFVLEDEILLFTSKGRKIFSTSIDGDILPIADIYQFSSSNKKIGVFDKANNKIYLINSNGDIYRNFPLKGQSRFSIGFLSSNSNHFNLIVGGDNNYLYNYRIE